MKKNLPISGKERDYSDNITIISTTDTKGIITYVNQGFVDVSGFSEEELLGKNHNIVRHPDMPPVAFRDLWDTVKTGKAWRGTVKNRCKSGDHYWVDAYVTPVYEDGKVIGYQSVRSKPKRVQVDAADRLYRKLNESNIDKLKKPWRPLDLPVDGKALAAFIMMALLVVMAGVAGLNGMRAKDAALHQRVEEMTRHVDSLKALWGEVRTGQTPQQQVAFASEFSAIEKQLGSTHARVEPNNSDIVIASMGLALALAVLLTALNRRLLTVPLLRAMESAKAIAGGDLTQRVEIQSNDELGQVLQAVKMMQARLQTVIGRISEFTDNLVRDANEMSTVAQQSNQGMHAQRSETEMVATAMNEMSTAVQEVAFHAQNAANAAGAAADDVADGKHVMGDVISTITALAQEVERAGTVMAQLEHKSEEIGGILDVIRGIAEQTNLLALNAAIEAARAGDQGRGFAVVADEVRTLAQRTQDSTQEIQRMIEGLQTEARGAAGLMRQGREQARSSVEHATRAGAVLDTISNRISDINDLNTQIATAAEEQSAVSEEINRNINNIAGVAQQTEEGADRTAICCNHLAEQTLQLKQLVAQFKLA